MFLRGADPKQRLTVRAKKEVILAAGTIHSAQLLLLSGIGPKAALSALNISVRADLQGVGQHYIDGAATSMQWSAPSLKFHRCLPDSPEHVCEEARQEYFAKGAGLYGTPGFSAGAFVKSRPEFVIPVRSSIVC